MIIQKSDAVVAARAFGPRLVIIDSNINLKFASNEILWNEVTEVIEVPVATARSGSVVSSIFSSNIQ